MSRGVRLAPLPRQTHYIKNIRYPARGRLHGLRQQDGGGCADIEFNHELVHVSFEDRTLFFSNGSRVGFSKLVNTLPLPVLIQRSDAPA
jgi:hypothetical protein